jgi:beta-glucosidase
MKTSRSAPPARASQKSPAYRNPALPAERRVKDLLRRMTLEEKAAQMVCVWQQKAETLVDEQGNFDLAKARKAFRKGHGLGQVGRPSDAGGARDSADNRGARAMAELTNDIQRFFLENSRLGIPVIFHEECLHGHAAIDGTSFSPSIPNWWSRSSPLPPPKPAPAARIRH